MLKTVEILIVAAFVLSVSSCAPGNNVLASGANEFQSDADLARLEHLEYWTGLVEEYERKIGHFPFADDLKSQDSILQVRIATADQASYFTPDSENYVEALDNNKTHRFQEVSVRDFVAELEKGLGRPIEEKYDIQYAPSGSPIWYYYFVTADGYLIWVTCITCDVTPISTLLFDGYTPTVNIVSEGMQGQVSKALIRTEMLSHPIFLKWKSRSYIKEGFVRNREKLHSQDSKENSGK